MPQLLPFYFVNQMTFALFALFTITYVMSVYVLPYFVQLFVTRVYITKLQLKNRTNFHKSPQIDPHPSTLMGLWGGGDISKNQACLKYCYRIRSNIFIVKEYQNTHLKLTSRLVLPLKILLIFSLLKEFISGFLTLTCKVDRLGSIPNGLYKKIRINSKVVTFRVMNTKLIMLINKDKQILFLILNKIYLLANKNTTNFKHLENIRQQNQSNIFIYWRG